MSEEEFKGKNLVELLNMLEPVPEPPAISMWPETSGWIWLGIAMIALLAWGGQRWISHRQANAYRRAAIAMLAAAGDDPIRIAKILRRTALAAYPRDTVAPLSGEAWLTFLDKTAPGCDFLSDQGRSMAAAPYQDKAAAVPGLGTMAAQWIRQHKTEGTS